MFGQQVNIVIFRLAAGDIILYSINCNKFFNFFFGYKTINIIKRNDNLVFITVNQQFNR